MLNIIYKLYNNDKIVINNKDPDLIKYYKLFMMDGY